MTEPKAGQCANRRQTCTVWRSLYDTTPVRHGTLEDVLTDVTLQHKAKSQSRLWSPAVITPQRTLHNVTTVNYLVYDIDVAPYLEPERLRGLQCWYHPTHSATEAEPKVRLIVGLTRPVLKEEYRRLWLHVRAALCPKPDEQCKDASRAFFVPPAEVPVVFQDGGALDVDAWLAAAPPEEASYNTGPSERIVSPTTVPKGQDWDELVWTWASIWPDSGRHELVMAVAGTLGRGTWPDDDIARFCVEVSTAAGAPAEGIRDAELTARDRLRRLAEGEAGYGVPRLRELLEKSGVGLLDQLAHTDRLVKVAGRRGLPDWAEVATADDSDDADPPPAQTPELPDPRALCRDRRKRPRGFWVDLMNAHHCVLTQVGTKVRILSWQPHDLGGVIPCLQTQADFVARYAPHTACIEGVDEPKSIGAWWLAQSDRREAGTLVFRPDRTSADDLVDGNLNTWRGYGIEPRQGDWTLLRKHLNEVICDNNPVVQTYVTKWIAWVLQHPGERAGTVLVLRGGKGTGKNTLLDAIVEMFGQHGIAISNQAHLTGHFNAHLHGRAFLFANEAVPPGDKAAESRLKALVTDPVLVIERKGINAEPEVNALSIAMATNEAWCVPASGDERRFCVIDVSKRAVGRTEYWRALHAEMAGGGKAAMLHDMLCLELGDWHPRLDIPKTTALDEQKLASLRGADRHVRDLLQAGEAPDGYQQPGQPAGREGCMFVATQIWAGTIRYKGELKVLRDALVTAGGVEARARVGPQYLRGYWLPPLPEARATWSAALGVGGSWSDDGGWHAD